ncbi:T9SS type A sorting domain-containing protein, partial [Flavobacterium sp.]|uniref:T9SS type A sorting domain-containing protein n=1 Tax=Flavobacterium sp. TaxID=239 RepID=UPI002B4B0FF1
ATSPTYNTGFEQEGISFIGWATPNTIPVAGDWEIGNFGAGALVQDGVSSVVSITPAAAAANNWLFSRGINLTAGSSVTITYYLSNFQNTTTATGSYQLTVGNSQSIASQTTVLANETGVTGAPFVLKTYTFTPPSTGVYYFGFRNYTPMNATGTHALIIDNFTVTQTLKTDEFLSSKFSVYPNPVKDVISITNSENITINEIQLTDLNGRVVKQKTFNQVSDIQVNISDLASGIYMMNINSDQGSATKKIIKN